jgi:outer membrane immunogenic protein
MRKFLFSSTVALAVLSTAATPGGAADLSVAPAYKAPAPVPLYNWTGIYLGVNGGYGWGQQDPFNIFTNRFDALSVSYSGGTIGGTAGAQIQSSHVLLGVEADIDWANITGSATVTPTIFGVPAPFAANLTTNINSISTGRMRVCLGVQN